MRGLFFSIFLISLSSLAMAETLVIPSKVVSATIHPDGAVITREVTLDIPAGRHRIQIPDIHGNPDNRDVILPATEGVTFSVIGFVDELGNKVSQGGYGDLVSLELEVDTPEDFTGIFSFSTVSLYASWKPVYDVRFDQKTSQLTIERRADILQVTGENWDDVRVSISLRVIPSIDLTHSIPQGKYFKLEEKPEVSHEDMGQPIYTAVPGPEFDQDTLTPDENRILMLNRFIGKSEGELISSGGNIIYFPPSSFSDQGETYNIETTITLRNEQIAHSVFVDSTAYEADVFASIYAGGNSYNWDSSVNNAYLYVTPIFNEIPLYPEGKMSLYHDGAMIAAPGRTFEWRPAKTPILGFGQIPGLTFEKINREFDRNISDVDDGINEQITHYDILVSNMTAKTWAVQLLEGMPHTDTDRFEDLEIIVEANPPPTQTDWNDRKGVYAWGFDLSENSTTTIEIGQSIRWPNTQMLR